MLSLRQTPSHFLSLSLSLLSLSLPLHLLTPFLSLSRPFPHRHCAPSHRVHRVGPLGDG